MRLKGAKTLVTGAGGFIGSHLAEMLVARGAHVRALVQYNSFNSWDWLEHVSCKRDMEVIAGDIRDPHFMTKATADIEVVFHLAALIAIPYSYIAPDSYVQTNVTGTLNTVQAALRNHVGLVVHTSTSEVYGTAQRVPIDESHPLQPQSPYSASKIAADAMAMSFHHAMGLPVLVARPFNTYGPRQSARAVISTIISQISSGQRAIKLGSLTPTRDFNYVTDTCAGFLALAECDAAIGQTVNIGSTAEISIGDLTKKIQALMGTSLPVEVEERRLRPEDSEVERLCADASRLASLTGFHPQVSLEQGLKATIAWFRDPRNLSLYKADAYNV